MKYIFPPLSRDCIWNLIEISLVVSEEKSFENLTDKSQVTFGQGHQGHPLYKLYRTNSQMLHTKFQGNRPRGSGEEGFLRFLPYMVNRKK